MINQVNIRKQIGEHRIRMKIKPALNSLVIEFGFTVFNNEIISTGQALL